MLNNRIKMTLKKKFTLYPLPSFFKDLSENEKLKLLKKNKLVLDLLMLLNVEPMQVWEDVKVDSVVLKFLKF